jgi:hypothetical protein
MTHQLSIKDRIIAEGKSKGVVRGREGVIPTEIVIRAVTEYRANKKS